MSATFEGFVMRSILVVLMWSVLIGSVTAQDKWLNIANSDESSWDFQPKSLDEVSTRAGVDVAVVVGRVVNNKTKKIDLRKWYVSVSDCGRQMGSVVALDVNGNYQYENDFVFGSGTIATALAEAICSAYTYRVKNRNEKGI